jgi:hypothetical protein
MLQLGQITALGTVVFTAVLLVRNAFGALRIRLGYYEHTDAHVVSKSRQRSESAVLTQIVVWAAGVLAVYMVEWAGLGSAFTVGQKSLLALGVGSKIVIGLMAASTLSTVNVIKAAFDNTDSARVPPLLGNPVLPLKPGDDTLTKQ